MRSFLIVSLSLCVSGPVFAGDKNNKKGIGRVAQAIVAGSRNSGNNGNTWNRGSNGSNWNRGGSNGSNWNRGGGNGNNWNRGNGNWNSGNGNWNRSGNGNFNRGGTTINNVVGNGGYGNAYGGGYGNGGYGNGGYGNGFGFVPNGGYGYGYGGGNQWQPVVATAIASIPSIIQAVRPQPQPVYQQEPVQYQQESQPVQYQQPVNTGQSVQYQQPVRTTSYFEDEDARAAGLSRPADVQRYQDDSGNVTTVIIIRD